MSWHSGRDAERLARVLRETEHLPPRLGEWLYDATEGVGVLGRRRIIQEISAHYDKAHARALDHGAHVDAAHADALESLGDAKVARGRFRRKYLKSSHESQMIRTFGVGPIWLLIPILFGHGALASTSVMDSFFVAYAVAMSLCAVVWRLVQHWKQSRKARRLYRFVMIMSFVSPAVLFCIAAGNISLVLVVSVYLTVVILGFVTSSRHMPETLTESDLVLLADAYPENAEWYRQKHGMIDGTEKID